MSYAGDTTKIASDRKESKGQGRTKRKGRFGEKMKYLLGLKDRDESRTVSDKDYYTHDKTKGTRWSSASRDSKMSTTKVPAGATSSTTKTTKTETTSTTPTKLGHTGQGESIERSSQGPSGITPVATSTTTTTTAPSTSDRGSTIPSTTTAAVPVGGVTQSEVKSVIPPPFQEGSTSIKQTETQTQTSPNFIQPSSSTSSWSSGGLSQQQSSIIKDVTFVDQWNGQPVIVRRVGPADELARWNDYFAPIESQLVKEVPPIQPQYFQQQQPIFFQQQQPQTQYYQTQVFPSQQYGTQQPQFYTPMHSHHTMMFNRVQPVHRRSLSQPLVSSIDEQPRDMDTRVGRSESGPVRIPISDISSQRSYKRASVPAMQSRSKSGYHPENLPLKERGHILEDDLKRFYHEKEEEHELLDKEPILTAPAKHRARIMESEIMRFRQEKEEEQSYLRENPIASKSVRERSRLLGPILTDAEFTKQKMRPLLQMSQQDKSSQSQVKPSVISQTSEISKQNVGSTSQSEHHHSGVFGTAIDYIEKAAEAVKDTVYHAIPGAAHGPHAEESSPSVSSGSSKNFSQQYVESRSTTHPMAKHVLPGGSASGLPKKTSTPGNITANQNTFTTRTSTSNHPNASLEGDSEIKYL